MQLCSRRVTYVQDFSFFGNHKIFRDLDCVSLTVLEFFHADKHLSDMFPMKKGLKQGDALPPKLFNFALKYAIRSVQVNQDSLKLNGTNKFLFYADDVNILVRSVHTL